MSNLYGIFVPEDADPNAVREAFEEGRRIRESAGPYEPSIEEAADLEKELARMRTRFAPQFEGDPPPELRAVWRLAPGDSFAKSGVYSDTPRSWPRCVARAELNGDWEDLYLTEEGRWRHRDDRLFGAWLPMIGYALERLAPEPPVSLTGLIGTVPIDSDPAREACVQHGINGTGFGTDPKTGWQDIRQHPLGPTSRPLPWRFRIVTAGGQPWPRSQRNGR